MLSAAPTLKYIFMLIAGVFHLSAKIKGEYGFGAVIVVRFPILTVYQYLLIGATIQTLIFQNFPRFLII